MMDFYQSGVNVQPEGEALIQQLRQLLEVSQARQREVASLRRLLFELAVDTMLNGSTPSRDVQDMMGITQESNRYMVGLVELCDMGELFDENGHSLLADEDVQAVKNMVSKAFLDNLSHVCIIYPGSSPRHLGSFLINLPDSSISDDSVLAVKVSNALHATLEWLEKFLGLRLLVALSGVVSGIARLPRAMVQAEEILKAQLESAEPQRVVGAGSLTPEKNAVPQFKADYVFEQELLQAVNSRDMNAAYAAMSAMMESRPAPMAGHLSGYVSEKLVSVLVFAGIDPQEQPLSDLLRQIAASKGDESLTAMVSTFFIELDRRLPESHTSKAGAPQIMAYIQEHFSDRDISLSGISDSFNQGQSGISRDFKTAYGAGVLETIHRLRVDKAKTLLQTTDRRIDDIFTSVGYSNRRTFDRAFKQYTGETPADCRRRRDG